MNLAFFYLAIICYALAATGYIIYFIMPDRQGLARVSLWATAGGFILHSSYFLIRWLESGRIPITTFFEAISFLGLGLVLVFLLMEFRYKIPSLGSFMLPMVLALVSPAAVMSRQIGDLNPVLKSGWLGVHTSLAVLGDSAFAFSFIVSLMYLLQERQLKLKHLGAIFHRLPPLDVMDTLSYRALTYGWLLFTAGMVTGSLWAESAWGAYWNWDPKETWSLIVWVMYMALLHLRTIGWRGKRMAYLSVAGFIFVLMSFFVVSRVGIGKHSF